MCLSVREHISRTTWAIFTEFLMHVAYRRGSVVLRQGDEIEEVVEEGAVLGVLFTTDNALYSIAFGTHTNMAEPSEMPFWMKTLVGPRNHMLHGVQIP